MAADQPQWEVFQDEGDLYRWRIRAVNGEIIATSGEGFQEKAHAKEALMFVKAAVENAEVEDLT